MGRNFIRRVEGRAKKKKASANIFHSHLGQEINNLNNKNFNRKVWRKNTATYKCDVAFKGVCARAKCVFLEENKRVFKHM